MKIRKHMETIRLIVSSENGISPLQDCKLDKMKFKSNDEN